MARSLDREICYFDENIDTLRSEAASRGKDAVLIHGGEVIGYFDTVVQAARDGHRRFGTDLFLARSVSESRQGVLLASILRG